MRRDFRTYPERNAELRAAIIQQQQFPFNKKIQRFLMKKKLFYYLGIGSDPVSNHEKIFSALGGFIGIYSIIYISTLFVGAEEMVYIVPSMGASAVLLFAVPP